MRESSPPNSEERLVRVAAGSVELEGTLAFPQMVSQGTILFAHGSGSSRHSPRNRHVAGVLRRAGFTTLLLDLLTAEEDVLDAQTRELRFDIPMLAQRLVGATDWVMTNPDTAASPIGYFGASTGAGAALIAAVERPQAVHAVVSRGGRPDLAASALERVQAPTLLIVGGDDMPVISLNRQAFDALGTEKKELVIIPHATHLFEEPGTLEEVAWLAAHWFTQYLRSAKVGSPRRR